MSSNSPPIDRDARQPARTGARPTPRVGTVQPRFWRGRLSALGLSLLLWMLALVPGTAQATLLCSPYLGQVIINELRVGASNATDSKNQVEFLNLNGISSTVWHTWKIEVYTGSTAAPSRKTSLVTNTGYTSSGAFIWNSTAKLWLKNKNAVFVDVALLDANGDFVAYIAIEGQVRPPPTCYGATTTLQATGSETNGSIRRTTDGGVWPTTIVKTSVHTIGRTNECTAAGADPVVGISTNRPRPVVNLTTVSYTVTIFNNACSTTVSSAYLKVDNLLASNYNSLVHSSTIGSRTLASGTLTWNIGDLLAGATQTLTISGVPRNVGLLTHTAWVSAPTTGLFNTADDIDTETINTQAYNYIEFDITTVSVTEGTDFNHAASLSSMVPPTSTVTVNYIVSGTANSGDTNLPASGSVTINPAVPAIADGNDIVFTITNDAVAEPTKTIVLTITSVTTSDTTVRVSPTQPAITITLYDDDPIDHYELSLPTASLACLPSTVTVTACNDTSSPCTNKSTTFSGYTATLATSAGTLGATSVTFNASGVATTTLSHPSASNGASASVTLSGEQSVAANARKCCPNGSSCAAANSCATAFSTAGFIVAAAANGAATTVATQVAGTSSATHYLRAVTTGTTTKACEAALSGANTVNWAYQCNNPATCSAGNLMSIDGGTPTTIARNNSGSFASTTAVPMTFDANGNAPFSLQFSDVGQATLSASKTVNSATLTGTSNAFVTKPSGFTLSAIAQTAAPQLANPAAAAATGAKFVKAGEAFGAMVTAVTSGGVATPNYGKESPAEGVLLTRALVLPAGGAAGTLANATIAGASFSAGVASVTNLAWDEVGIITLTPAVADGDYLGVGNVTGTTSANIGRFVPDHFRITAGTPLGACSAATSYFGQDGITTPFTLKAENAANATTQNYTGSFAKLGLTSWSGYAFSATGMPAGSVLAASATAPTGSWSLGLASVSARHQISRPTALAGETAVTLSAAPADSDGVTMTATALGASTALRYGRLRLSNAFGSASAALQVPVAADYWSGSAWLPNTADSCTTLVAANVAMSNPRNALGNVSTATSSASAVTLSAGQGVLTLGTPSPSGSSLTLDLALNLGSTTADASCQAAHPTTTGAAKPWLRSRNGSCSAAYDSDPSARASFGVFSPESRKTVHVREIF